MNWLFTSFLMFISSIVYYLIIKKAQIEKIESKLYMVANFSIPMFLYMALAISQKQLIFVGGWMILIMFLNSLIFSYFGSIISYWALEKAPNAGYSLTIQKSYAVYTAIASVFLFNQRLSPIKFLAILIIVISTAFILIDKKTKNIKSNNRWIFESFSAFFIFGTLRLNNRLIIANGVSPVVQLLWTMFFVTTFSIINLIKERNNIKTKLSKNNLFILLGMGLSVSSFYYFLQISEVIGPNLGYVSAINTASNAFYTVLVAWIFKDHLSAKKFFAVLGVTFGLILLVV